MLYLLDANVLITANNTYYSLERVPQFWDWLLHHGQSNRIKIVQEVYEEVRDGTDGLAEWARLPTTQEALLLGESVDIAAVRHVTNNGYAPDLTDDELEQLGRDPFLIAYAYSDVENRVVVTTEVSKPSRVRQNRHVPDVCAALGIRCCSTFDLTSELDFTTR